MTGKIFFGNGLNPRQSFWGSTLFLLEERLLHQKSRPLLCGRDIRALLNHFLPRRDTTLEEDLRQMEVRHRKRRVAIDSAYRNNNLKNGDRCSDKVELPSPLLDGRGSEASR